MRLRGAEAKLGFLNSGINFNVGISEETMNLEAKL